MKRFFLILFFACAGILSFAQQDSCALKISLLTCAPGEELYSTFGHTAIRVQDSSQALDIVFNYGTFEFTPDFNIKFVRGKLLYSLSVESFADFLYSYQMESRSVWQQNLNLTCSEKQRLFAALHDNASEGKRDYKYDFLFDNCTTRAGNIITKNAESPVVFPDSLPQPHPTFRNMLHEYLDAGHQPWSKLGIDILLGAKLDRRVTLEESFFLPDYLMRAFDQGKKGATPLVSRNTPILKMPSLLKDTAAPGPAPIFTILFVIITALSFFKKFSRALAIFDFLFFFILGLAGLLLVFMWLGTDHVVCRNNYNLLWALPTHAVLAFFVHSSRRWVLSYFRIVSLLMIALLLLWFFLPQNLNEALLPVTALAAVRSWFISKRKIYAEKAK